MCYCTTVYAGEQLTQRIAKAIPDAADRRVIGGIVALLVVAGGILLSMAGIFGLSVRVFQVAAGI